MPFREQLALHQTPDIFASEQMGEEFSVYGAFGETLDALTRDDSRSGNQSGDLGGPSYADHTSSGQASLLSACVTSVDRWLVTTLLAG